ncbi:hypothetical protein [Pseudobacteriovorax antillogorgiicola]|uniref:Uncharacterized protein n=1 Tax=Pseudobacteriovorax antillogorgiicola TaxID=1513793 RepID=A0A1Y6CCB3_9BACT|nr:hypothetical protein [Pseudobacteriovorax antillogorgiicola]TCS49348.1 hypothetical protein EDD56_11528 [Pseudobacteriovorax antillogorgiicola]SMF47647.1 hypothetical protein SAMN06296036_114156 [Pseudobacteriovorax antillogorgiicola]
MNRIMILAPIVLLAFSCGGKSSSGNSPGNPPPTPDSLCAGRTAGEKWNQAVDSGVATYTCDENLQGIRISLSCNTGFTLEGDRCVEAPKTCDGKSVGEQWQEPIDNGTGAFTCNASQQEELVSVVSCEPGYEVVGLQCTESLVKKNCGSHEDGSTWTQKIPNGTGHFKCDKGEEVFVSIESCNNAFEAVDQQCVAIQPKILTFSSELSNVKPTEKTKVTWTTQNVQSCTLKNTDPRKDLGYVDPSGELDLPYGEYLLKCTGDYGEPVVKTITITNSYKDLPYKVNFFTATPDGVNYTGAQKYKTTLKWDIIADGGCRLRYADSWLEASEVEIEFTVYSFQEDETIELQCKHGGSIYTEAVTINIASLKRVSFQPRSNNDKITLANPGMIVQVGAVGQYLGSCQTIDPDGNPTGKELIQDQQGKSHTGFFRPQKSGTYQLQCQGFDNHLFTKDVEIFIEESTLIEIAEFSLEKDWVSPGELKNVELTIDVTGAESCNLQSSKSLSQQVDMSKIGQSMEFDLSEWSENEVEINLLCQDKNGSTKTLSQPLILNVAHLAITASNQFVEPGTEVKPFIAAHLPGDTHCELRNSVTGYEGSIEELKVKSFSIDQAETLKIRCQKDGLAVSHQMGIWLTSEEYELCNSETNVFEGNASLDYEKVRASLSQCKTLAGNYTLGNQELLDNQIEIELPHVEVISGELSIGTSFLKAASFPALSRVGSLTLKSNNVDGNTKPTLFTLNADKLVASRKISLEGANIDQLKLPSLSRSRIEIQNITSTCLPDSLYDINLPSMTSGSLTILNSCVENIVLGEDTDKNDAENTILTIDLTVNENDFLETISIKSSVSHLAFFYAYQNDLLKKIELGATEVLSDIFIWSNPSLADVSLRSVNSIKDSLTIRNNGARAQERGVLDLSGVEMFSGIEINQNQSFKTVTFNNEPFKNRRSSIKITSNHNLTGVNNLEHLSEMEYPYRRLDIIVKKNPDLCFEDEDSLIMKLISIPRLNNIDISSNNSQCANSNN